MDERSVLVTTGTDFLAAHCIAGLLDAGWRVRVALPSLMRSLDVQEMVSALGADPSSGLGFVEADVDADRGWAKAVDGREAVVHCVSRGVERILDAARGGAVARVIVLGSSVSLAPADGPTVTGINHARLLGPIPTPELLAAADPVRRLLQGRPAAVLPNVFEFVDARDVAELVSTVLEHDDPAALPALLTASAGTVSERLIADQLRDEFDRRCEHIPWVRVPRWWVRALATIRPTWRRAVAPAPAALTGTDARAIGWLPRELDETITDTAESVLELEPPGNLFDTVPAAGVLPLR